VSYDDVMAVDAIEKLEVEDVESPSALEDNSVATPPVLCDIGQHWIVRKSSICLNVGSVRASTASGELASTTTLIPPGND
jgi:hypothetical protein